MKMKFKAVMGFSMLALVLASCSADPDSPGLEYMPDMYRSAAIEPYVDYGELRGRIHEDVKLRRSAMVPPKYAIPYAGTDSATVMMMLPYNRKPSSTFATTHGLFAWDLDYNTDLNYQYNLAAADQNPIKLTSAEEADKIFAKGKALFTANCQHCHGEKGDGNGPMVVSGAFSGVPDYKNLTIAPGQMFYSIYYGKGAMGSHMSIVNKKEIWTIIHHIKRLQDSNYGKFDAKTGMLMSAATAAPAADSTAKAKN